MTDRPLVNTPSQLASGLYRGTVRHRRFGAHARQFQYRLNMLYIDLDEVETLFDRYWLWSNERRNVASFFRRDHFGDPATSLNDTVRQTVQQHLGRTPQGPIRLLTQPRYFGYVINPIALYYCFQPDGTTLDSIVAEVTNTPWGERHCYVIDPLATDVSSEDSPPSAPTLRPSRLITAEHTKAMHVSPFLPMEMTYKWSVSQPGERLSVQIEDYEAEDLRLDATLLLERTEISSRTLAWSLISHPCMTLRIAIAIYWQAFRLWWKGVPFVPHPRTTLPSSTN
ncbi:MAG: DUF1365 domain-containing protein [Planctomycetaceae bacterium]